MFKLRPYQQKASDWCFEHLLTEGNCLLVACVGSGKTCVFSDVAKRTLDYLTRELGRPAHGICLIGQNEIHQQNLKTFNKYAPNIRTAVFDSNIKSCKGNMIFAMIGSIYKYRNKLPMFDFVVVDECFAGNTKITTMRGAVQIKDVKVGDLVLTYNEKTHKTEYKKVLKNIKKPITQPLIKIGKTICTENHKFYTNDGWVEAKRIQKNVLLLCLRQSNSTPNPQSKSSMVSKWAQKNVLFKKLFQTVLQGKFSRNYEKNKSQTCKNNQCKDESKQPNEKRSNSCQSVRYIKKNKSSTKNTWWKWARGNNTTKDVSKCTRVENGVCGSNITTKKFWLSNLLQNRYSKSTKKDSSRSGRQFTLFNRTTTTRHKKREFFNLSWVEGCEIQKQRNTGQFARVCKEGFVYDLTVEDNHNYFADGFLVHNCHHSLAPTEFEFIKTLKAKNPKLLVFGVTATPNRGDKVGLLPLFTNYYKVPIGLLFKCGYLVKPTFKVFDAAEPITLDGHKKFLESIHANKVGKTVVFCKDVPTALMYRDLWNETYADEPAVCVHGELSGSERADVIDKFKHGHAPVIFNVAVLTEGFDDPQIETAVLAKHYGTKGQYIQAVGRALRTSPGKTTAYILDYCGNYTEHGDLQENVDLEGEGKSVKGRNVVLADLYESGSTPTTDEIKVDFCATKPQYFTPYGEELNCINWFECESMGVVGALNTQGLGIIIVGEDCYITHDKVKFEKMPIENLAELTKNSIMAEDKPATAYQLRYLAGKYNIVGITKNRADSVILFDLWRQFA